MRWDLSSLTEEDVDDTLTGVLGGQWTWKSCTFMPVSSMMKGLF